MTDNFNLLIDGFIKDRVGLALNFLDEKLCTQLSKNFNALHENREFQSAGTGNQKLADHDKSFRSDLIYWLDRSHKDPYEDAFFDHVDAFVLYLNNTCYTGINGYEFHYALYEKGTFYKKHIDQFRNDGSRQYSLIMYLNEDWQEKDGGELCIHHGERIQKIAPVTGLGVFFKSSELEHEVLLTQKPRLSIVGWLKVDDLLY